MSDVTFVLCIEDNAIKSQSLLLIESIRAFTGAYKDSDILAISPRGLGVDQATQATLRQLGVHYLDSPINTVCPEYGSANRIYAGAWAARNTTASTLIVLDSDTIFLDEPILLGSEWDAAVRPVDVKGSTSSGADDPLDAYWQSMCRLADIEIDALPWIETTIDRQRVRASYNGGYLVVRRDTGILEKAAEIFTRSVSLGLRPLKNQGLNVVASTGPVGLVASEYWGSNQAALSVAIWSLTQRVLMLDPSYNIPLHSLTAGTWGGSPPVLVHYHWCFDAGHIERSLQILSDLGVPADRLGWIRSRTPLPE
jgi:hypothetical protein